MADADLTTNRSEHLAAWRNAYAAALTMATWWSFDTESHATTNVVVIAPVVTHFRAPLPGGMVEVQETGGSWSPTAMTVDSFKYGRIDGTDYEFGPMHSYSVAAFTLL